MSQPWQSPAEPIVNIAVKVIGLCTMMCVSLASPKPFCSLFSTSKAAISIQLRDKTIVARVIFSFENQHPMICGDRSIHSFWSFDDLWTYTDMPCSH